MNKRIVWGVIALTVVSISILLMLPEPAKQTADTLPLNITVPPDELEGIFNRGLRMNSTSSGKRITLSTDDLARVRKAPVASLTYLPSVRLEEAIFAKRFGAPSQRIRETRSGTVHWLYPQHGLDVTLGGDEKPLLQYVSPGDFELLRAPLLAHGEMLPS